MMLADVWGIAHDLAVGLLGRTGRCLVQSGGLILILWVVCGRVTALPSEWRCWLWRLLYLQVLVAFLWVHPVLLAVLPPNEPPVVESLPHAVALGSGTSGTLIEVDDEPMNPPVVPGSPSGTTWVVVAWSLAVLIAIGPEVRGWLRLRRQRRHG